MNRFGLVLLMIVGILPLQSISAQETTFSRYHVYGLKDGMAMYYDVETPVNPNGFGVIFVVSGGWLSREDNFTVSRPVWEALLSNGYTVFELYHPGMPTYRIPDAFEGIQKGVQNILENAGKHGVSENKLGIFGLSSGGHLALLAAFDHELLANPPQSGRSIGAVVAYMPPTDLRGDEFDKILFGSSPVDFDPALIPSLSPIDRVTENAPPTLLIHGTNDHAVNYARNSGRLFEELQRNAVTSKLVPVDAGHEVFAQPLLRETQDEYLSWLSMYLKL